MQKEDELLRGQNIFARDVINHLRPSHVLRNIESPTLVLTDGLQQQAALLFGPVQAMFLSESERARDFGGHSRWRHPDIGALLDSLGWVGRGIGAVAYGCGAGGFGDEALVEIIQAR